MRVLFFSWSSLGVLRAIRDFKFQGNHDRTSTACRSPFRSSSSSRSRASQRIPLTTSNGRIDSFRFCKPAIKFKEASLFKFIFQLPATIFVLIRLIKFYSRIEPSVNDIDKNIDNNKHSGNNQYTSHNHRKI